MSLKICDYGFMLLLELLPFFTLFHLPCHLSYIVIMILTILHYKNLLLAHICFLNQRKYIPPLNSEKAIF